MISSVVVMGLTGNKELPPTKTYQKSTAIRVKTSKPLDEPWAVISSWDYEELAGDDLDLKIEIWVNDNGVLLDCVHRGQLIDAGVTTDMVPQKKGSRDNNPGGFAVLQIECTNYRADKLLTAHKQSLAALEDAWA